MTSGVGTTQNETKIENPAPVNVELNFDIENLRSDLTPKGQPLTQEFKADPNELNGELDSSNLVV